MSIGVAVRAALGKTDQADHRARRRAGIVQGVVTGLANRAIGVAVSLIAVPLTIGYLGTERYGVWALIGSLLAWGRLADIGIGNGLTNLLTSALGAERMDLARAHISTGVALFSAIGLGMGILVAAAWPWIDWGALFGVRTALARAELGPAIAVAIAFFLLGFPLSVVGRTFAATQEGRLGNYWAAAGRVAGLLTLIVVSRTRGGLLWLVIAMSGTALAVNALSGVWLFVRHRPSLAPSWHCVRRQSVQGLLHVGAQFFLLQIMALIVFETDNLVIAHFLGASQVPPYSLTYSLFGYTSIIQGLLFSYVWVGYTDAIARGEIRWVQRTFLTNLGFSLGFSLLATVPLIFIARPFIRVWAGAAVVPPFNLVLWMAAWCMINALCSPIACLLAAASHMKAQVMYSAVGTAANIALSLYLVRRWGVSGVIAGTVISYAAFVVVPASFDVALLLRRLRRAL